MTTANEQKILTRGAAMQLRIWENEAPSDGKGEETRPYETVGYVVSGVVEIIIDGKSILAKAGDGYVVPEGASHRYVVKETLTAVEAISPPQ